MSSDMVCYTGGCHCGSVRFQVYAPAKLHIYECNCSICVKKQNNHFIVPGKRFTLLQGEKNLTIYTFNTHKAKHMFCKTCGVQCFYVPRSNPDGYGICPHCLDPGMVKSYKVEKFDGENWETHILRLMSSGESLDPDPNRLTLIVFLKELFEKKVRRRQQKHEKLPSMQ